MTPATPPRKETCSEDGPRLKVQWNDHKRRAFCEAGANLLQEPGWEINGTRWGQVLMYRPGVPH